MIHFATYRPLPAATLAEILQAADPDQLLFRAKNALAPLNIDELMVRTSIAKSDGTTERHLFGTLANPLLKLLGSAASTGNDPVDLHFSTSHLPLAWATETYSLEDREAYVRLGEHGIRCGVSVLIRGERTVSRIDFYARSLSPLQLSATEMAELNLLGLYLHEAKQSLAVASTASQAPLLTVREKECLHWVASGKTAQEAGMILGISSHTVSFHLKNVSAKLNVYGTRYAIAKAIALGIIHPTPQTIVD